MVDGFDTTIPLLVQLLLAWLCFLATCVDAVRRRRAADQACPLVRNVLSGVVRRDGRGWLARLWAPAEMRPVPVRAATGAAGSRSRIGPGFRATRPPF